MSLRRDVISLPCWSGALVGVEEAPAGRGDRCPGGERAWGPGGKKDRNGRPSQSPGGLRQAWLWTGPQGWEAAGAEKPPGGTSLGAWLRKARGGGGRAAARGWGEVGGAERRGCGPLGGGADSSDGQQSLGRNSTSAIPYSLSAWPWVSRLNSPSFSSLVSKTGEQWFLPNSVDDIVHKD